MARDSQAGGGGWIKNPHPSWLEVALYTVLYVFVVILFLPLILVAFVIISITDFATDRLRFEAL